MRIENNWVGLYGLVVGDVTVTKTL